MRPGLEAIVLHELQVDFISNINDRYQVKIEIKLGTPADIKEVASSNDVYLFNRTTGQLSTQPVSMDMLRWWRSS